MARLPRASGFTLIEAMVAMAILMIGTLGLISLHSTGVQMNADARVVTRATQIGHDLLAQIHGWSYDDPRLKNVNKKNDADYTDHQSGVFESKDALTSEDYDHAEAELESAPFNGIPTATVQALGFQRYINIDEDDVDLDENGAYLGRRVAVIVRWGEPGRWRRVVLLTFVPAPALGQ